MKLSQWLVCLCVAVGVISFVSLTDATEPTDRSPEGQLKLIPQIDFKGGKVRDLIEILREQTGANIVTGPGVDDVPLPDLKLRNVTVIAAVNAISMATGGIVQVGNVGRASSSETPIFTLRIDPSHKPADAEPDVVFRAFRVPATSLAAFDEGTKNLASAIDRSLELYNQGRPGHAPLPRPRVEVHRETCLVLVTGTRESVKIVAQVFAAWTRQSNAVDVEGEKVSAVKVTILGAVQKPGVYSVDDGSLAQLIGLAGGLTDRGDSKHISVLSKDGTKSTVNFKTDPASYTLREGDVVTVPQGLVQF